MVDPLDDSHLGWSEAADKTTGYRTLFAQKIVNMLSKGTAPWLKPWKANFGEAPFNPATGGLYRALNRLVLSSENLADPRWLTLKQVSSLNLYPKKEDKGVSLEFWESSQKIRLMGFNGRALLDMKGREVKVNVERLKPRFRRFKVYNYSNLIDAQGRSPAPFKIGPKSFDPFLLASEMVRQSGAKVIFVSSDRVCYDPRVDAIFIPELNKFNSPSDFYASLLHELGHWTWHPSRLARDCGLKGDRRYSREEMRVEIASWMICQDLGLDYSPEQHLAYLSHWYKNLEEDPCEIARACHDAEDIKDYLIEFLPLAKPSIISRPVESLLAIRNTLNQESRLAFSFAPTAKEELKSETNYTQNQVNQAYQSEGSQRDDQSEVNSSYAQAPGLTSEEKKAELKALEEFKRQEFVNHILFLLARPGLILNGFERWEKVETMVKMALEQPYAAEAPFKNYLLEVERLAAKLKRISLYQPQNSYKESLKQAAIYNGFLSILKESRILEYSQTILSPINPLNDLSAEEGFKMVAVNTLSSKHCLKEPILKQGGQPITLYSPSQNEEEADGFAVFKGKDGEVLFLVKNKNHALGLLKGLNENTLAYLSPEIESLGSWEKQKAQRNSPIPEPRPLPGPAPAKGLEKSFRPLSKEESDNYSRLVVERQNARIRGTPVEPDFFSKPRSENS
jgi:antirestriction protein ArdC